MDQYPYENIRLVRGKNDSDGLCDFFPRRSFRKPASLPAPKQLSDPKNVCVQPYIFNPNSPSMANAYHDNLWGQNQTIKISLFFRHPDAKSEYDYPDAERKQIEELFVQCVEEYKKHVNLKFEIVENEQTEALIRVGFDQKRASYSFVGVENRFISKPLLTMNICWLKSKKKKDADEVKRENRHVILHELGHLVGLNHEHQRVDSNIKWDVAKVYNYFYESFGWDNNVTYENVLRPISIGKLLSSEYDASSIMHYWFPDEFSSFKFKVNYELSEKDKEVLHRMYPKSENLPDQAVVADRLKQLESSVGLLLAHFKIQSKARNDVSQKKGTKSLKHEEPNSAGSGEEGEDTDDASDNEHKSSKKRRMKE